MAVERTISVPRIRRRTAGDILRRELEVLACGAAQVESHKEQAWASITFAGARHRLVLLFTGEKAIASGEVLIDALPDHEFTIPRHLVADADVVEVEHRMAPSPVMRISCELLLLEDA